MSTPVYEHARERQPDEPVPSAQEAAELTDLGAISDTQGGLLGAKYDTAVGWQYY